MQNPPPLPPPLDLDKIEAFAAAATGERLSKWMWDEIRAGATVEILADRIIRDWIGPLHLAELLDALRNRED